MRAFVVCASLSLMVACGGLRLPADGLVPPGDLRQPNSLMLPLEEIWAYDAGAAFGPDPILLTSDHVLIVNRRGEVHAVNRHSGRGAGSKGFGDSIEGRPVLEDDILIIPVKWGGAGLQAFDVTTGKVRWRREGSRIEADLVRTSRGVVAATLEGTVHTVVPRSGDEVWSSKVSTAGYLAAPVVVGDVVVVVDQRGLVAALDVNDGAIIWRYDLGLPVHRSPFLSESVLVIPTTRGRVIAVDLEAATPTWIVDIEDPLVRFTSPHIVGDVVVVAGTDGMVRSIALDDGSVRWSTDLGASIVAPVAGGGDQLIAGTMDGTLVVLDAETGDVVNRTQLRGRLKSAMVIDDEGLLLAVEPRHVIRMR